MVVKAAISLSFLTILFFLLFKSFWDFDAALIGINILFYGWVATKIIGEGLWSIIWLILRHYIDSRKDPPQ
jgi:hypothetical protein